jgi:predicted N-formylglutamate amidohydrolase
MALLGPGDPPPFETLNADGTSRALLVCDHASCAVPAALGTLGLSEAERTDHIGWDIGAAAVTRRLAALLDAPALLAGYSRLVIDCNRPEAAPDRVPEVSDGVPVPGNASLDKTAIDERIAALFTPYHAAIRDTLDRMIAAGTLPFLVAVHSFTPHIADGAPRPWEISICSDKDRRTVAPMLALLRADGLTVGDNEPYAFGPLTDYTIPEHAEARGLPHVLFEIRNDQIRTPDAVEIWATRLAGHLRTMMQRPETQRIEHST